MMSGSLREQLNLELGRRLHEPLRILRGEGHLELRRRIAILVVRHVEAVEIGDRRHLEGLPLAPRGLVDDPEDGIVHQRLEPRLGPRPFVVPVRRVEHAALALRPHPRPWLAPLRIDPLHQDRAVDGIVLRVHVRLVPGLRTARRPASPDATAARSPQ